MPLARRPALLAAAFVAVTLGAHGLAEARTTQPSTQAPQTPDDEDPGLAPTPGQTPAPPVDDEATTRPELPPIPPPPAQSPTPPTPPPVRPATSPTAPSSSTQAPDTQAVRPARPATEPAQPSRSPSVIKPAPKGTPDPADLADPGATVRDQLVPEDGVPTHEPPAVVLEGDPGDQSKALLLADADDTPGKLPRRGKVKECCGYPISRDQEFKLSFYWLAYESEYATAKYDTDIYSKDGTWIGRYPNAFVFELKLEGSGILRDGRVLNYDGECRYGVGTCFKFLDLGENPMGRGVQARPLEPFRSIAVDPRYIPIGAPVFIPELVGVQMPDGQRHDGCLRADDQGGAIKLHKIDFFVESYQNFKFFADQLWWKLRATPYLDEPRCEYLRTYHPRERDNEHTDWVALHSRPLRQALAQKAHAKKRPVWASSSSRHRGGSRSHTALALHHSHAKPHRTR